jgi:DNA-binding CsgD family transcriptional regulator
MRLYGREDETRRIDQLLDSARAGRSGVLLLRGDPGIGKTALIRYARTQAVGMTVLHAQGLEVESALAFSGLSDLFRPVLDRLGSIPPPQSAALAGALGIGAPVFGDRFVVYVATLSLLAAVAEEQPVLLAVDDTHWLDEGSREALLFTGRRLEAERVAIVMTALESEAIGSPAAIEQVQLSGLETTAASALLMEHVASPIAPQVVARLVRTTQGNPLALQEAAVGLTERQLAGLDLLVDPLPAGPTLEAAFGKRLDGFSAKAREALLVVAASNGDTRSIEEACILLGLPSSTLDAAEQSGLIQRDGDRMAFSHPLLRAAVYHTATSRSRGRVHRALAEVQGLREDEMGDQAGRRLSPSAAERRAWQMAAATSHPAEAVASALEQAATSARSRGGYAASASALERAAALTPGEANRTRRLVEAARDWHLAGHGESAGALLDDALTSTRDDRQRAEIQQLRAHVQIWQGEWASASTLLAAEAPAIAESDPARAALMLVDAAVAACSVGELERGLELARTARTLGRRGDGTAEIAGDVVYGSTLVFLGDTVTGAPLVLRHIALAENTDTPPVVLMLLPHVLICLEEYDQARGLLDRLVSAARGLGAPSLLAPVLPLRAELAYRIGDWFAGYADAVEGLQLARETNQNLVASLVHLAQIEAVRGLEHQCRDHAAEALDLGTHYRIEGLLFLAHALLGKLELGLGRIDEAITQLETARQLGQLHSSRHPNLAQEEPDLIEALVRSARGAEAKAVLATLERQAQSTNCIWAQSVAGRCRGLLADEESFERQFELALMLHQHTPTPFDRARTELCFGERLRRAQRSVDARRYLRSALQTFDRLGAAHWAKRARSELAASGETVQAAASDGFRELTPQELQLALIVGRGATNKEAAAALFISPKTVEAHLHRTYLKLGIRSRTELARQLARAQMLD